MKTVNQRAIDWVANGDSGLSSMTIWTVMMGAPNHNPSVPWDPSDFRRCHMLLELIPEWRERLCEVASAYPQWDPLVRNWDMLTSLYNEERSRDRAPKLFAALKALTSGDVA